MIAQGRMNSMVKPTLKVSHIAETLRRYPGERVVLFTRVQAGQSLRHFRVQVKIPPGLKFEKLQAGHLPTPVNPLFSYYEGSLFLIWDIENETDASVSCDFQVTAVVTPTREDRWIESTAEVIADQDGEKLHDEEAVTIAIKAKGAYLKYLPSIYQEKDELMGRLLMLFESFLAPLEQRIDHMPDYLDAHLTPPEMMPWLASWTGLVLDSDLSEKQRRMLLWKAGSLYLRRGTREEMREYLEIVTGGKVIVIDSPGFRLGPQAFLGMGTVLGKGNLPFCFNVTVHLPPLSNDLNDEEKAREKKRLEGKIRSLIETEKPAHTGYELQIIYEDEVAVDH